MAMESFGFYNDYSQLRNTLSISIRDNKYKVDFSIDDLISKAFPDSKSSLLDAWALGHGELNKEEFLENSKNELSKMYRGKKLEKNYQKYVVQKIDELYPDYESNYQSLIDEISSVYKSLEDKIKSSDDW